MESFTPYTLPAIIVTLLGVSLLVFGGWGIYTAVPDGPKYAYSVSELDERLSDSSREVVQFTELSDTGREAFLASLNQDREYQSDQRASEVAISTDHQVDNYVEYQNQTYVFVVWTNYSGLWILGLIFYGAFALVGVVGTLLGGWSMRANRFKLPTAVLAGVLAGIPLYWFTSQSPYRGYDASLFVWLLPIPVLMWFLLSGVERHWDVNFSRRMDR